MNNMSWTPQVAVIIPCLNEAAAIGKVVSRFSRRVAGRGDLRLRQRLHGQHDGRWRAKPGRSSAREPLKGKGNVVARMFADVEADVYVMVDGDDTYDAASAPSLIQHLLEESLDMVNGAREETSELSYRRGHRFGNRVLTGLVAWFFGERLNDMLSGYRIMSRRFVKSFPALASGFETETELTVHALQLRVPIAERMTPYRERPPASASKLRTIPDGIRILRLITRLIREEKPLEFFSTIAVVLALAAVILAVPVLTEYWRTGLVPRLPTAVLSTGLMLLGFLSLMSGLILATVTRGRMEAKRLQYLTIPIRAARR